MCEISRSHENAKRSFSFSPTNLFNLEQELLRSVHESLLYLKNFQKAREHFSGTYHHPSTVKVYIFGAIGYNYPHLFYQLPCEFNAQTSIQVI
jgi:hypothetical protein